jgi:hypothetical protein
MAVFGLGQKAAKNQREADHKRLCDINEDCSRDIARLQELADVFKAFPGWEAFRQKYLVEIRLPKLNAAAAKALAADEKTRNQLAGQIAEAEFLAQALPIIEEKVRRLTLRQKSVQEKMMLHDSHKTGSE